MSRLVPAYNVQTHEKLPYLVPEHHFDNPLYKGKIARTPRSVAATSPRRAPASARASSPTTQTPAAGDEKE